MVAGADKPVTKQRAPLPSFLSESMKISRMVEVLEGLTFDSREQGRIVVDRVTRNWPDVARSGDERSLPSAVVGRRLWRLFCCEGR
jgi:hypothetical protein